MTRQVPDQLEVETQKKGLFSVPRCRYQLQSRYDGQEKGQKHWFAGGCRTGQDISSLPFTPPLSGMLQIELKKCRLYDPFRVFSAGKKTGQIIKIAVFPQDQSDEDQMIQKQVRGEEEASGLPTQESGGDGDLRQIRPWVPGDSQRQVHWKLSARMQETMIREWNEEKKPVRQIVLKRENKVYTAEEANRFYDELYAGIASYLKADATAEVSWKGPDGLPEQMHVVEMEDLKKLLVRLYESRWLWEGKP